MTHIFADMIMEWWLKIYMNDLGIHTQGDLALHHEHTWCILLCLRKHGLSLKLFKCIFDAPCIELLGMIIGQGKIEMDSVKLSAIKEWKPPALVKGVWSFLGFMNFYRQFILNFSHVVALLNLFTRKDQPWAWTSLQQWTFESLKSAFFSGPVLFIYDITWPFSVMTDASLFTAGAVLFQADTNGNLHPCAYFSRTFLSAECNYVIYNHKLLAVILTLSEWKQYIHSGNVTQSPFSLIIRTSLTSKTLINYPDDRHNGPFFFRIQSCLEGSSWCPACPSGCSLLLRSCWHLLW